MFCLLTESHFQFILSLDDCSMQKSHLRFFKNFQMWIKSRCDELGVLSVKCAQQIYIYVCLLPSLLDLFKYYTKPKMRRVKHRKYISDSFVISIKGLNLFVSLVSTYHQTCLHSLVFNLCLFLMLKFFFVLIDVVQHPEILVLLLIVY